MIKSCLISLILFLTCATFATYAPKSILSFDPKVPIEESDLDKLTLICEIEGIDPTDIPKVEYILNGVIFKETSICADGDTSEENVECVTDQHVIVLSKEHKQYNGNYSCRAFLENFGWTTQSDETMLDVHYKPGPAKITIHPMIAKKGRRLTLTCSSTSNPPPSKYHWYRGITAQPTFKHSTYVIEHLRMTDRDNYSCAAENVIGIGEMGFHHLEIYAPPKLYHKLEPHTHVPYLSEHSSLTCAVECYPICNITWKRNGEEITNDDPNISIQHGYLESVNNYHESVVSSLVINILPWAYNKDHESVEQKFECISSDNLAGPAVNSSTKLVFQSPPHDITVSNNQIFVREGYINARIVCNAQGIPEPSFYWKNFRKENITQTKSLDIKRGLSRADSGVYTCVASNLYGTLEREVNITVLHTPNCTISLEYREGKETLICEAHGNPPNYDFMWEWRDKNNSDSMPLKGDFEIGLKSYLTLQDGVSHDMIYQCFPNNSVGFSDGCEYDADHGNSLLSLNIILVALIGLLNYALC